MNISRKTVKNIVNNTKKLNKKKNYEIEPNNRYVKLLRNNFIVRWWLGELYLQGTFAMRNIVIADRYAYVGAHRL